MSTSDDKLIDAKIKNNIIDTNEKTKLTDEILEQDMFETTVEFNKRIKDLGFVEIGSIELNEYDIETELFYFQSKLNSNLKKSLFNISINDYIFAIKLSRKDAKELFEYSKKYKILAIFSYTNNVINIDELKFYKYTFIKLETDDDEFNINLGIAYGEHNPSKKLDYLLNLKLNNNARALRQIGNSYTDLENYNESILWFKKAIEIAQDKYAYSYIGNAYSNLENYNEAIIWYKKAIEIAQDKYAYLNIGNCYLSLEKDNEAIQWYNKAIQFDAKNADVFNGLGSAYNNISDFYNAAFFYRKALEIDPNHDWARIYLDELENNY